ncbi:MAG TPA: hypothetical protein VFH72_02230 [Candidatus Baltobacteraceae bacterium]|nr:hypothetical protein [Candidatus Baltobacteraceae bacterium]
MSIVRMAACAVIIALTLTSCGHHVAPEPAAVTLPQLSLQAPVQNLVSFDDAGALALYGANPVVPLFAIPNIDTNLGSLDLTFWGTKDSSGQITQLTEAGVSGLASTVHIFFDTSERPVYFRDDGSGYAFILSYDSPTHQTVTVCDPSGAALANAQILISGSTAQAGTVSDGGSCILGLTVAARTRHNVGAQSSGASTNLGDISALAKLITAGSSIAGLAFGLGAILKFKQHKDNPTQTPFSTPIALVFIAAALIFLPAVFQVSSATLFGSYAATAPLDGLASFLSETSITGCSTSSASCPFPSPEPTP